MTTPHDENVLVMKLGALGDLILADGALRDIRDHHPGACIHLLTRRAFAPLMQRCPWIDIVHIDENAPRWRLPALLRWRRWFTAAGFNRTYDLQNSARTRFYRRWLATPQVHWSALTHDDPARALAVPDRHAGQLRRAGITVVHAPWPAPTWIAEDASQLLHGAGIVQPFVLLLPGASARHPGKRWPGYAALAEALSAANQQVVIVLGPDEANDATRYAGCVLRDGNRWLSISQLAGVAMRASCVVGNDSGPLHLAASVGAPCVALFEAGNPSLHVTGIERRNAIQLIAPILTQLGVDEVLATIRRLMPR